MFKRKDVPPVLLLSTLILLVILTLSQILVVHNGTVAKNRLNMRKLQIEMRELDFALHSVMKHRVPSVELNRRLLQNEINAQKFKHILQEASKTGTVANRSNEYKFKFGKPINSTSFTAGRSKSGEWKLAKQFNPDIHSVGDKIEHNEGQTAKSHIPSSAERLPTGRHSLLAVQSNTPLMARLAESHGGTLTQRQPSSDWETVSPGGNTAARGFLDSDSDKNANQPPSLGVNKELVRHKAISSYCPAIPPHLTGEVSIDFEKALASSDEDIVRANPDTGAGGSWRPHTCAARHKVAVVIPYRARRQQLQGLLYYLHPMLQKQQLDYTIFVVEQQGNDTFNKATLMNIAFTEGLKLFPFHCVLFHDVDLVPENDRNMYSCPQQPRHLSVAIDEMGYKLAYPELVGGVLNMRTEHFQRVNGYSNLYWGWGAEDDDMAYRIMQVGLKITRPPGNVARYRTIKHKKRQPANWKKRAKLLITGPKRFQFDGLNSLSYELVHIEKRPLFTHILVNVGKPPRGFS